MSGVAVGTDPIGLKTPMSEYFEVFKSIDVLNKLDVDGVEVSEVSEVTGLTEQSCGRL